ncbi:hypothetical protein D3C74_307320 [compost metagenome]
MYAPLLFDVAEDFFQTGKRQAASILYETVAESEKQQHSERLALCKYRLFLLKIGKDQNKNHHAAIQFEPYVERLDEIDQLEAIKDLANLYRSLRKWDKLEELAVRLEEKAKVYYFSDRKPESQDQNKKMTRPVFTYYAYPYILLTHVYLNRREYKLALETTSVYADLEWVREKDEETLYWKSLFQEWALANTFVVKLFSGDISVLSDYIAYFEARENEMLLSFMNIVEAANKNNFNIDPILQRYKSEISFYLLNEKPNPVYSTQNISEQAIALSNELAEYHLRNGQYHEGFQNLMICLEKSSNFSDKSSIIKCVGLFEHYKENAPYEIIKTYQTLINEVYKNEKKINVPTVDN